MPGSTPATSQLDWLSSTTAMIVLSWSKATRDLLKSFSWGITALRQLFASDDGAISSSPAPYHLLVPHGTTKVSRSPRVASADFPPTRNSRREHEPTPARGPGVFRGTKRWYGAGDEEVAP